MTIAEQIGHAAELIRQRKPPDTIVMGPTAYRLARTRRLTMVDLILSEGKWWGGVRPPFYCLPGGVVVRYAL